ncbi:MAG TPA: nitrite/sulfite reductase [Tepidisphaeraceae bacterium]|jgi:sulfite reductase (ferredoxin)|nr:nitrite/sulfite reductase [Tepidisphaeraceae bacterium]
MSNLTWREKLADVIPTEVGRELDNFEAQMMLRKGGKIEEKTFAELRLRRGAYGQRYDNGHRHDGIKTQDLNFPQKGMTKGPETEWDAPGMMRIKIPGGSVSPLQLNLLADLADEYSDAILHVTTRQDFQLHYVHIEDTPDLMRRLAAVGITTKEACGNSVRNVTACPLAGVCHTEAFDVTPYSKQIMQFFLGHPDTMEFGRKFKIALSGCQHEACALVSIHDLGLIAVNDGGERKFDIYVGGGLGAVPFQAKLLAQKVAMKEVLPLSQAVGRLFARMGEKKNRQKARLKFVVQKVGIEEFKKLVAEERKTLPHDVRWDQFGQGIETWTEQGSNPPTHLNGQAKPEGFEGWFATNVYRQRQPGYAVATVTLPLGDMTSDQARAIAVIADRFAGGNVRTTVEQNLVLRWVSEVDLPALYLELKRIGLSEPGAGTIIDVTSCPGTDTCKLGIASSRGLAGELRERLAIQSATMDAAVKNLRIKVSGCFNSCGQHHVADIGFYGNSRNIGGYTVPHFQVMLGGQWTENVGSYGQAIGSIPSKAIPTVVERLTKRFVMERAGATESFQAFTKRLGKKELKGMLEDLTHVPAHDVDATYYTDWGDPREFTIGDMGTGECAGEVISLAQFGFAAAESMAFESSLKLEEGEFVEADRLALGAMMEAAKTLVKLQFYDVPDNAEAIVGEFKTRFVETKLFWDRFHHGQFANYLINRVEHGPTRAIDKDWAERMVQEAPLFIDAAHACHMKMQAEQNKLLQVSVPATTMDPKNQFEI